MASCLEIHQAPFPETRIKVSGEQIYIKVISGAQRELAVKRMGSLGEAEVARAGFEGNSIGIVEGVVREVRGGAPIEEREFQVITTEEFTIVLRYGANPFYGIFRKQTGLVECGELPSVGEEDAITLLAKRGLRINKKSRLVTNGADFIAGRLGI